MIWDEIKSSKYLISNRASEIASLKPGLNVGSIIREARRQGDRIFHEIKRDGAKKMVGNVKINIRIGLLLLASIIGRGSFSSPTKNHGAQEMIKGEKLSRKIIEFSERMNILLLFVVKYEENDDNIYICIWWKRGI